MKVRLQFSVGHGPKEPVVVEMKTIPRTGESLVSGAWGTCVVSKVMHTPDTSEQDVILEVVPEQGG